MAIFIALSFKINQSEISLQNVTKADFFDVINRCAHGEKRAIFDLSGQCTQIKIMKQLKLTVLKKQVYCVILKKERR